MLDDEQQQQQQEDAGVITRRMHDHLSLTSSLAMVITNARSPIKMQVHYFFKTATM